MTSGQPPQPPVGRSAPGARAPAPARLRAAAPARVPPPQPPPGYGQQPPQAAARLRPAAAAARPATGTAPAGIRPAAAARLRAAAAATGSPAAAVRRSPHGERRPASRSTQEAHGGVLRHRRRHLLFLILSFFPWYNFGRGLLRLQPQRLASGNVKRRSSCSCWRRSWALLPAFTDLKLGFPRSWITVGLAALGLRAHAVRVDRHLRRRTSPSGRCSAC